MCENNNTECENNNTEGDYLDISKYLNAVYNNLEASTTRACMAQMQQKRFDLDILDAEAIRVSKFSSELLAYSFKTKDILKKLSDTRNLWVKLNGITKEQAAELEKKCVEARDKAVKELEAHLKEFFNG